jgi:hypothetical protein
MIALQQAGVVVLTTSRVMQEAGVVVLTTSRVMRQLRDMQLSDESNPCSATTIKEERIICTNNEFLSGNCLLTDGSSHSDLCNPDTSDTLQIAQLDRPFKHQNSMVTRGTDDALAAPCKTVFLEQIDDEALKQHESGKTGQAQGAVFWCWQ